MKPEHTIQDIPDITYDDYIKPSNDPARREGLILCMCLKDGGYAREGNAVHFDGNDLMENSNMAGGHFSKLFPPDLNI